MGNGEGPGVTGEVWAMGRDLEWLERCGQWGGTWSGWRGVGNGEGPGVTGEVWAMGRDLEWLERCGQWGGTWSSLIFLDSPPERGEEKRAWCTLTAHVLDLLRTAH